jgi:hypothetical protein
MVLQVVHHLFPNVCHTHYPAIAPIVLATCAEFGVPYKVYPSVRPLPWETPCMHVTRRLRTPFAHSFYQQDASMRCHTNLSAACVIAHARRSECLADTGALCCAVLERALRALQAPEGHGQPAARSLPGHRRLTRQAALQKPATSLHVPLALCSFIHPVASPCM